MLGQVLSWVLLGQSGTVQQLPLKEWQVGLQKEATLNYTVFFYTTLTRT